VDFNTQQLEVMAGWCARGGELLRDKLVTTNLSLFFNFCRQAGMQAGRQAGRQASRHKQAAGSSSY
jgi:hypothetical protein